jgi:oligosaccharide repeat unit polymerase
LFNKKLRLLLVVIFIVELVWSGGFPLIWLVLGDGRTHVDFGIPTLHGAFHGILLFFVTSSFLLYHQNIKNKVNLIHIGLFLLYAAIVFNRGIVIIFTLQAAFIYLVTQKKIKLTSLVLLAISFLVFVITFGILGDFRSGGNVFSSSVSGDWGGFFEVFGESLVWFYVYTTGGLNNLYFNLLTVDPTYFPRFTLAKLVPTVGYDLLGTPKAYDSFNLADDRLTVSTAFQGLVSDFGIIGIFGYLPVIFAAQVFYRKARSGSVLPILCYGMLMQTIVMTTYIDTVFYLTFLLQLFLVACCAFNRSSNSILSRVKVIK